MKKKAPLKKRVATGKARVTKKLPAKAKEGGVIGKPVGVVTHFYTAIKVAIIKCKAPIKVASTIYVRGSTTDFKQKIASLQYDHAPVGAAKKGQEVGIKVGKRVREGDLIYLVK